MTDQMTDAQALASQIDDLVAQVGRVSDVDYLGRLANGHMIAIECADFIRDHGQDLAARLRTLSEQAGDVSDFIRALCELDPGDPGIPSKTLILNIEDVRGVAEQYIRPAVIEPAATSASVGDIDNYETAIYLEHVAGAMTRLGYRITGATVLAIAKEHAQLRAHSNSINQGTPAVIQPMETAPNSGVIRLVCESKKGRGERRVFAAEASYRPELTWIITTGWCGWTKLHPSWNPVGWMPIDDTCRPQPAAGDRESEFAAIASRAECPACGEGGPCECGGRGAQPAAGDAVRALPERWRDRASNIVGRDDYNAARKNTYEHCADLLEDALAAAPAAPAPVVPEGWRPIGDAPSGSLCVVGWLDAQDPDNPERHDFDFIEEGRWVRHDENVEHAEAVAPPGSTMPSRDPPYQWFMEIPAMLAAAPQAEGNGHG